MNTLPIPTIYNTHYTHDEDSWCQMDIFDVLSQDESYVLLKDSFYFIDWENHTLVNLDLDDRIPKNMKPMFFEVSSKYLTKFKGYCDCGTCENLAEAEMCYKEMNK